LNCNNKSDWEVTFSAFHPGNPGSTNKEANMNDTVNGRKAIDDASAHQELVREFSQRLDGLQKQALWLGMPFVAHFIAVAALGASEATFDHLPRNDLATQ
jgi:hypothetical protein